MSVALANIPIQSQTSYRSSAATTISPVIRSVIERPYLLLGSDLLREDSVFSTFFQEVKALQCDEEEDAPPDAHALAETLRLVPYSRDRMAQRWMPPRVSSDGFGGLRLSWNNNGKELRAVISGGQTDRDSYLYWEDGNGYGTVPNFTPATLYMYLEQMEKAAPFER